jgi:hypothetical protein
LAVVDMTVIKLLLAIAATWNVDAIHADAPNAYVQAELGDDYDLYMELPRGMRLTREMLIDSKVDRGDDVVLKRRKSLYELKQGGRLWGEVLNEKLEGAGFTRCVTDMCLYHKWMKNEVILVGVYVDDLLIASTQVELVSKLFEDLEELLLKSLGPVTKFLGMNIAKTEDGGYKIDQGQMIKELLKSTKMEEYNGTMIPIGKDYEEAQSEDSELLPKDCEDGGVSVRVFQSITGSLLWLARCTRPDVLFAVHKMTRKTHVPTKSDWKLVVKTFRYLKQTIDLKLFINPSKRTDAKIRVEGYSDADWTGSRKDRKSISGGVTFLNEMPISWHMKKQSMVSLSTMEAEYVACSEAAKESLGIREIAKEIGLEVCRPLELWCDNQAAICQAKGEGSSERAKHIDMRIKFIITCVKKNLIEIKHVPTVDMIVDVLTKPLSKEKMRVAREMICMKRD